MPDAPHLRAPVAAALATGAALLLACGGGTRPPAAPPPRTPGGADGGQATAPPPETPEPPPAPTAPAEPAPTAPRVVIEPTEPDDDEELTLAEAARRERARRQEAGQPIAVINDANLDEHAVGQLTFMEDEPAAPAGEAADPAAAEGPDEQYWRDRVRRIRQRWADAAARVPTLEERVAELRRRFYEADDAYYRDSRIKPAWDRAIDQIAQSRAEAEAHKAELETALAEGRLAGALPGWLREGIELEPEPFEPSGPTHEPGEPEIVEPGEAGDP